MPRRKPPPEPPKRRPPGTGSVVQRKDGRICVYLPKDLDPDRKPLYGPGARQPFTNAAQATGWLDAEIVRRRSPDLRVTTLREPLGAYLDRWWRTYGPSMPARTADHYRAGIRRFASIGHIALGDLTPDIVQAGIAAIQAATWRRTKVGPGGKRIPYGPSYPFSATTIRHSRKVLHLALEQLVPHILPYNPVRRTRTSKEQPSESPVWDALQSDRFLAAVKQRRPALYLAARLILRRALRRGEVLAMKRDDVDVRRRLLQVDETAGDRVGETGDTKGRRTRDIPLSADLVADVTAHLMAQKHPSSWVFPGGRPGKPLSLARLNHVFNEIIDAEGLSRITPKDMRATAATILLDENVSLARVSRLLGHSSVAVTAKFYDRILAQRQGRIDRIADELDAAFERASETAGLPESGTESDSEESAKVSDDTATR